MGEQEEDAVKSKRRRAEIKKTGRNEPHPEKKQYIFSDEQQHILRCNRA